eukprot:s278_g15.t1
MSQRTSLFAITDEAMEVDSTDMETEPTKIPRKRLEDQHATMRAEIAAMEADQPIEEALAEVRRSFEQSSPSDKSSPVSYLKGAAKSVATAPNVKAQAKAASKAKAAAKAVPKTVEKEAASSFESSRQSGDQSCQSGREV